MPSHSEEQAKTMSAIAHGWKPKGKAADIPVKVAKEFHAADKGKKYGKKTKGYDRSGHQPGNPGFTREGKAPYKEYNAGAHAKQSHGHPIGYGGAEDKHKPNQSYFAEQREHWGNEAEGKSMKSTKEVAFTGPADRGGSELQEKCGMGHDKQPSGKSIGGGRTDIAEHHKGHGMGGIAHTFKPPAANMAHGYGHAIEQRKGPLRMSGHSGAHRVGHRSK